MNRSIQLVVILLGLMAASPIRAEEASICTSMCASEKEQCTIRARKQTEFDKSPAMTEKNAFARTAAHSGPKWSESERATERVATHQRDRERIDACDASYLRCTRACKPAVAPVTK